MKYYKAGFHKQYFYSSLKMDVIIFSGNLSTFFPILYSALNEEKSFMAEAFNY